MSCRACQAMGKVLQAVDRLVGFRFVFFSVGDQSVYFCADGGIRGPINGFAWVCFSLLANTKFFQAASSSVIGYLALRTQL